MNPSNRNASAVSGQRENIADVVVAVASEHQAHQSKYRSAQIAAIIAAYRLLDVSDPIRSWLRIGPRIVNLITLGQVAVASESVSYVARALAPQGVAITPPHIEPRRFAGLASDGRPLESLVAGAPMRVAARKRQGRSDADALKSGASWLTMVADTQIADAARAADSVVISASSARIERLRSALATTTLSPAREADIARRLAARNAAAVDPVRAKIDVEEINKRSKPTGIGVSVGWVRMLNLPSCLDCIVLAGRWYRWNAGFERHPSCDCRHIPAIEAIAGDITISPIDYFESLSESEQNKQFGKANSQAIRDGADIGQVVNAHRRKGAIYTADDGKRYTKEGISKRSSAQRSRKAQGLAPMVMRPTVWQIYKDARGNRQAALRGLREFGYIL